MENIKYLTGYLFAKRKLYSVLQEELMGDRVEALRIWLRVYPKSNPVRDLGEDPKLWEVVRKKYLGL